MEHQHDTGSGYLRGCAGCQKRGREKAQAWRNNHPGWDKQRYWKRKTLIDAIKMAIGCVDCGWTDSRYPDVLEFDHVRGEKWRNVSLLYNRKISTQLDEIEKCEVVCANCHRIRTSGRRVAA